MTLFVLDTDHVSLLEKGNVQILKTIIAHSMDTIAITVITIEEQLEGWQRALRQATQDIHREQIYRRMAQTVESLSGRPILPYTCVAMQHRLSLLRMRLNVGSNDLKISAIALEFQATVVTRNKRDFGRIPRLPLADWSV
ncbi:MAG: type II toxin-antitoxin system VapC family toxin [Planctomycetes bacterium]|jgi:tRNA(fMet)-specific endonuclease VapC|nr:type II toxin-antitoxin system VapC family toxin [Planctomycetota bacterium]